MPSLPTNLSIDPITAIDMGDLGSLGSYRKQNTLRRIEDSVLKQMKDKNATMQKAILQDPSSAASMFLTLGSGLQENRAMEEMRDLRRSVEVSEIGRVRRETAKKQFDKNVKEVESMVKEVFPNLKGRVDVRSVTEKFTDPQTGRPNRQAILEHLDEQNKSIPLSRKQKTERFKSIAIDLVMGFNKIDFVALNQGASGPNTAEVMVFDDNGKLVGSNRWNLATGVKATYIVVKEK